MLMEVYEHIEAGPRNIQWITDGNWDESSQESCNEIDYIFIADDVAMLAHMKLYLTIIIIIWYY